jgi:hypothetical protein
MNNAPETVWLRAFHRQMYVDLIRAYLRDYGSQRDLARALGLTEAYVSFLLEPLRAATAPRRDTNWAAVLAVPDFEIIEAFSFLKTPSQVRAHQLAAALGTEPERRDALLYHISMAQGPSLRPEALTRMPADIARTKLATIGAVHQIAQHSPDATASKTAHARVWSMAAPLVEAIDPLGSPVEYTQALMYLHDIAQVWDLHAQALAFARRAILALSHGDIARQQRDEARQLCIVAMHSEAVSLNTLGLNAESRETIHRAARLLIRCDKPEVWHRSLLEQELTALAAVPRISIYQAEMTSEQVTSFDTTNVITEAAAGYRLLNVYTAHGSPRSILKGGKLAAQLRVLAAAPGLTPLRRVQVLRALYRYSRALADPVASSADLAACLQVTYGAALHHQQREVLREASRP